MFDATATRIVSGTWHNCAITSSGAVECWGNNVNGQLGNGTTDSSPVPTTVSSLTNVVSLAAGGSNTCALTNAGAVQCWGLNENGQLGNGSSGNISATPVHVVGLDSGVAAISVGYTHACALTVAGAVTCWGSNSHGQLGNNSDEDSSTPVAVSGLGSGVVAIAAGGLHTCALTSAGAMVCWGYNNFGQLGNGENGLNEVPVDSYVPVPVTGLGSGVASITAGYRHTCAVTTSGGAKCWGQNDVGEVGVTNTDLSYRTAPVDVTGLTSEVAVISAGEEFTCAISIYGGMKCWGEDGDGQLGNNSTESVFAPVAVAGLPGVVGTLGTGGHQTCATTVYGGVLCWGDNSYGQLGTNAYDSALEPVNVVGLAQGVKSLGASWPTACLATNAGEVLCGGSNTYGLLGQDPSVVTYSGTVLPVPNLGGGIASVALGTTSACALTATGGVKCWGGNFSGQLGNGASTDSYVPVDVVGLSSGVAAVSVGWESACAVTVDGAVKCWGHWPLGDGTSNSSSVPVDVVGLSSGVSSVSVGLDTTCAVMTSGAVQCWGGNNYGSLGNGTTDLSLVPVDVSGIADATSVSVTQVSYTACATTQAGVVKCWGYNNSSVVSGDAIEYSTLPLEVDGPAALAKSVSVALDHACALYADNTVNCWGQNNAGQLGDGSVSNTPTNQPSMVIGTVGVQNSVSTALDGSCSTNSVSGIQCWASEPLYLGSNFAPNVAVSLAAGQYISFDATPSLTVGANSALVATSSGSGSKAIVFDTWTPSTCSVSGTTVTAIAHGLCGVRASRAAGYDSSNGTLAAAPQMTQIIQIVGGTPTLSVSTSATPVVAGSSVTFGAALGNTVSPTGNVVFCSDATTVNASCSGGTTLCTVSAASSPISCATSSLAVGSHSIAAYFVGDANNAAVASSAITEVIGTAPAITSANSKTVTVLSAGSFTVTASGNPAPALSESGALPGGMTFVDNGNGTATISGAPTSGSVGSYPLTLTAGNGLGANATQSFTLAVAAIPQTLTFTSSAPGSAHVGDVYVVSATASSNLAVAFSIDAASTAGACTLSGTTVTFAGTGTCRIDANQAGDANYAAASQVHQSVAVVSAAATASVMVPTPVLDRVALALLAGLLALATLIGAGKRLPLAGRAR